VISQRYERGSTVIITNRAFKQWPEIFNNDSTLTAALLDRLLHHAGADSSSMALPGRPGKTGSSFAAGSLPRNRAGTDPQQNQDANVLILGLIHSFCG
jgi:hypothetical protein